MTITFDKLNKYVIISIDVTEITIQEIYDAIRDFEDEVTNIEVPKIADCYGKQELGGGVLVGLTLVLYEWTIKFADRPGPTWSICTIRGGNLVALDSGGTAVSPITPSSFITTNMTSSSSATIQDLQLTDLKYRIESLRTEGAAFGISYYVRPGLGDDTNDGTDLNYPLNTIQHAIDIATSGDVIVILDCTVITEAVSVTKSGVHIRGNGSATPWVMPAAYAITMTGVTNCSVEDIAFVSCLGAIQITSCTSVSIKDCTMASIAQHAVMITAGTNIRLDNVASQSSGECSFDLFGANLGIIFRRCFAFGSVSSGIHINQGTGTVMQDCACVACQGYGFRIEAAAAYSAIFGNSVVYGNVLGNYLDLGVGTYIGSELRDASMDTKLDQIIAGGVGGSMPSDVIEIIRRMKRVLLTP